jgi:hypothetical protein
MSVNDWKFHDLDMLFNQRIKIEGDVHTWAVVYRMTGLPKGSKCLLCSVTGAEDKQWVRKTINEGMLGSVRYARYPTLNDAIDASIKWARRKDEERAA